MKRLVLISLAFVTFVSLVLTTIVFAENSRIVIKGGGDDKSGNIKVVDVRNPYIGILMDDLSRDNIRDLDYPESSGVLIIEVVEDSPAERAGLEDEDIIYSIDGDRVRDMDDLHGVIREREPGDTIDIVVYRKGEKQEVRLELGERARQYYTIDMDGKDGRLALGKEWGSRDWDVYVDDYENVLKGLKMGRMMPGGLRLGVRIHDMSESLAGYFGMGEGEGVLVLEVEEGSPADEAGIRDGDVIVRVGDKEVAESEDLLEALADYDEDDKKIEVSVVRKGDRKDFEFAVEDLMDEDVAAVWMTPGDQFKHFKVTIPDIEKKRALRDLRKEGLIEDLELDKLRKEIEILEKRLKRLEKDQD